MKNFKLEILSVLLCASVAACAADRDLANALAAAGSAHAAKGNYAQAKDQLFKALANDDSCPDAVFELAKIFDKEGNGAAGDFYQRASVLLAQDAKPANAAKRGEALARVKALNPFAPRFASVFEDYSQELDKLVKKNSDSLTQESALEQVNELKLSSILAPDKMPKFYAVAMAEKEKAEKEKKAAVASSSRPSNSSSTMRMHEKSGTTAPDVEKELKALGWTIVKGAFVKKGPGIYEATDARLEAPKINGAIDFTIVKEGSTGSLKATARSSFGTENDTTSGYYYSYSMPGFGFNYSNKSYRIYGPSMNGFFSSSVNNNTVEPTSLGNYPMPETPKVHFLMTVSEGAFEFIVNEKRNQKANHNKTPKTGPFVIDIYGTVILESPRCMGQ